jgi:hypothetical protein
LKVAFDIDQVLCRIVEQGRLILARELGVAESAIMVCDEYAQPFVLCEGSECLPVPVERSFWDREDLLSESDAFAGSVEALNRLHKRRLLAGYVTRRPPETESVTIAWMRGKGFPDMPVHFVGKASEIASYDVCKSTACAKIGATHLVDDHATELSNAAAAGIEVIVVDAETGQAARDEILSRYPGTMRVSSAAKAVALIESLDRKAA